MELVEHREGATRLLVPSVSLTRDPPPTSPVFFNPAASLNRDISVAITAATDGASFCDSMSGVGARGLRIANEVDRTEKVVLVDFNSDALKVAKEAAALNGLGKCEFAHSETSSYLHSRYGGDDRFDYVDVDPFGTPVRQLQAALASASDGGIVSVTATDTAVLCGVYPRVSERRYGAVSLKNHCGHETGIRVLAGAVARQGAQLDIGVEPVFAHSTRHYLRLFVRTAPGASKADDTLEHLGFILACPGCGHAAVVDSELKTCPACGKRARLAGPLWVHALTDQTLVTKASAAAEKKGLHSAAKLLSAQLGLNDYPPWSFSIEGASSSLKVPTVPESKVREVLMVNGWKAMRTPFEKTGIKTDAPYAEFLIAAEKSFAHVEAHGALSRSSLVSQGTRPPQK